MPGTHHQNIARLAALLLVATTAAAHAQGGAGGFVARATGPTDRMQLSANQIRAILTAHQPAIVAGTTEDNTATIVLASNGDYVASGTSTMAVGGVIRPATTNAVVGAGASSSAGGTGGGASAGAGGTATAVVVPRDDGQPHFIKIPGIGDIDASLLKDMYSARFDAGEVSVNAISVRIITLKGTAMR